MGLKLATVKVSCGCQLILDENKELRQVKKCDWHAQHTQNARRR